MSIAIIFDKSVFQSLNFEEVRLLHNYFTPNITPILVTEILGDLKKDYHNENLPQERVIDFANKLLPYNCNVNTYYNNLIESDLSGVTTRFDFRPHVGNSKPVITGDGKFGWIIEDSREEIALKRWREGEFLETERYLSSIWRSIVSNSNLTENLRKNLQQNSGSIKRLNSLDELNILIDDYLMKPEFQKQFLVNLIEEFGICPDAASKIFFRYETSNIKSLNQFSPYAFFCFKLKIFFYESLRHNLIGTRASNVADLQYLFYLPFCSVFSTSDKFQIKFLKYFMTENQTFVEGNVLKKDLKNLSDYIKTLDDKNHILRTRREPPRIYDSFTYQMWQKYYPNWPNIKIVPEIEIDMAEENKRIESFISAKEIDDELDLNKEPDFIVRKMQMKYTDLCFCGSGKKLQDCHLKN